jgi:hypothetical protein
MSEIDIERLKADPSLWPDGATHYRSANDMFYKVEDGEVYYAAYGDWCVSAHDVYNFVGHRETIPLQTKQEWTPERQAVKTLDGMNYTYRGGEYWVPPLGQIPAYLQEWDSEGLPPVGCECEVDMQLVELDAGTYINPWRWCEVLAHRDDCAILWIPSANRVLKVRDRKAFRPLKSPQERQREELTTLCDDYIKRDDYGHNLADAILSQYNLEPKE